MRTIAVFIMFQTAMSFLLLSENEMWAITSYQVEICDSGVDDDGDGLIDLQDDDCTCEIIEPASLIPNPSFEDQNCCPSTRSQLNCAEGWIQASEPTTDYIHSCEWMGWMNLPPPLPFPDGEGIMGFRDGRVGSDESQPNWKEYAGACLLAPLKKDVKYRIQFDIGFVDQTSSPPLFVTFFGTTDCENLPFGVGNEDFGCPTNDPNWVYLGSKSVYAPPQGNAWLNTFIDVIPDEDIAAIAIGPPCAATYSTVNTYYFFDNLILDDLRSFEFQISSPTHPCSPDFTLEVPDEVGIEYQWYKDDIALVGETSPRLQGSYGEGEYQVRTILDGSCQLTKVYNHQKPVFTEVVSTTLCEGESISVGNSNYREEGSYVDSLQSVEGCDSIVLLFLEIVKKDTSYIERKIFEGEAFEIGEYRFYNQGNELATLQSTIGCDSTVALTLSYYNVYQPNIFTPNGDGLHDSFMILGNDDVEEITSMAIYDKWGVEVFSETNLYENESVGWRGTFRGQPVQAGVYTYICDIVMDDGISRRLVNTITVLR